MKNHVEELAKGYFDSREWPAIECPTCHKGTLAVQTVTIAGKPQLEIRYDYLAPQEQYGNPADITGTFSTALQCNRNDCRGVVYASGEMSVDPITEIGADGEHSNTYTEALLPRSFYPSIESFDHRDDIPESVDKHLRRADSLVWSDPPASISVMRTALEALMTEQGYPGRKPLTGGRLSLDDRLKDFSDEHSELGELLLATKIMGNVGTHDEYDDITLEESIAAAGRIEVVLSALYAPNKAKHLAEAKAINAANGRPPV